MKKITIHSETVYLLSNILMALAVSMTSAADFGVSMIVAPAYILSLKVNALTFGQAEYIIQGLLFIVFCVIMKKPKISFMFSFITGIFYGTVLDIWRKFIPILNPEITVPGSMALPVRIILLTVGMVATSFAVALCFRTYLYPMVYDFFVKGITDKYEINRTKFKTGFDISCLTVSMIMTFVFFGKLNGIGIGTVLMTLLNGTLINLLGKLIDKLFVIKPGIKKIEKFFRI